MPCSSSADTYLVSSLLLRPAPVGATTAPARAASHPISCCAVSGCVYLSRGPSCCDLGLGLSVLLLLVLLSASWPRQIWASASRRAALFCVRFCGACKSGRGDQMIQGFQSLPHCLQERGLVQAAVLAQDAAHAGLEERGVGRGHGAFIDGLGDRGELAAMFGTEGSVSRS